jgi:hypothetical protein
MCFIGHEPKQKLFESTAIHCQIILVIMMRRFLCCSPATGGFIGRFGIAFTIVGFLSASYFFWILLKMLNYCRSCSSEVMGGEIDS